MVQLTYDPKGILENLGCFLGVVPARVKHELKCFTVPAPDERPHVA
jgi:hypothetical protein